jgi:uncharacterized YceG family protein
MHSNTSQRRPIRLTRRGRIVLVATGALVAATAVGVPLLVLGGDDGGSRPVSLVIPEGRRAGDVYTAIDKALVLPAGSSKKSLEKAHLKLPNEAEGNPEGYLFPGRYSIAGNPTPESLLKHMVDTADEKFSDAPIAAGAQRNAMNTYQAVTIASIVQAESDSKADMPKVARVIVNRLERGLPLQMDSTVNYALNRSGGRLSDDDKKTDSPYNTYQRPGLPPTPIGSPSQEAMRAAVTPAPGDWLYFVTVKPGDTRFTADFAEQERNTAERDQQTRASTQPAN